MDEQIKKVLGIFICIVVAVCVKVGTKRLFEPSLPQKIVEICKEVNKKCPMTIDSETVLENTTPGSGNSYSYNYKLPNIEKKQIDIEKLKKGIEQNIRNSAKESLKNILKMGITIRYAYSDKKGVFLFDVVITP